MRFAVASALAQNYDDFEVVVCDNNSTDDTAMLLSTVSDPRLRVVRSDRTLSMPENWELAVSHARGEYVTILADDCFLLPHLIRTAVNELLGHDLDVAVWQFCAYFDNTWVEKGRRNIVYVPNLTGHVTVAESSTALRRLFDFDQSVMTSIPKVLNSLCHRDVLRDVIVSQGRVFVPSCPDYSSAAAIMLHRPQYLLIDRALYLDGVTTASVGASASFNMSASAQVMLSEFSESVDELLFLGVPTSPSGVAASLQAMSARYPDRCGPLNEVAVLGEIVDRLVKIEGNGGRVVDDWQKVKRHIRTLPARDRRRLLGRRLRSRATWAVMRRVRNSARLERLETLRNVRIIDGRTWGFTNIQECAQVLMERGLLDAEGTVSSR